VPDPPNELLNGEDDPAKVPEAEAVDEEDEVVCIADRGILRACPASLTLLTGMHLTRASADMLNSPIDDECLIVLSCAMQGRLGDAECGWTMDNDRDKRKQRDWKPKPSTAPVSLVQVTRCIIDPGWPTPNHPGLKRWSGKVGAGRSWTSRKEQGRRDASSKRTRLPVFQVISRNTMRQVFSVDRRNNG
jgi:hypothetical protein